MERIEEIVTRTEKLVNDLAESAKVVNAEMERANRAMDRAITVIARLREDNAALLAALKGLAGAGVVPTRKAFEEARAAIAKAVKS